MGRRLAPARRCRASVRFVPRRGSSGFWEGAERAYFGQEEVSPGTLPVSWRKLSNGPMTPMAPPLGPLSLSLPVIMAPWPHGPAAEAALAHTGPVLIRGVHDVVDRGVQLGVIDGAAAVAEGLAAALVGEGGIGVPGVAGGGRPSGVLVMSLPEHGPIPSMRRKGNCWDNARMERFVGSLKRGRTICGSSPPAKRPDFLSPSPGTASDGRRGVKSDLTAKGTAGRAHP